MKINMVVWVTSSTSADMTLRSTQPGLPGEGWGWGRQMNKGEEDGSLWWCEIQAITRSPTHFQCVGTLFFLLKNHSPPVITGDGHSKPEERGFRANKLRESSL